MYRLISEHVVYPLYERVSGRCIRHKFVQLEASQWWPLADILDWQQARLAQLVRHAYDTVPYYRQAFAAAGLTPADVRSATDLASLPLLTKAVIQERSSELLSTVYPPDRCIANYTGGSIGTPMRFYQDQGQQDWGTANTLRCNRWAGWDFGQRTLVLWGHPRDVKATQTARGKLRALLLREHTFDAFGFSTADMAALADYIRRARPQTVIAYASMLAHFAAFLDERGLTDLPAPQGIIASTDMLFPHQRQLIERVLGAPVFNRYGCREVVTVAAECGEHVGMHINADRLVVEFVDAAGRPVAPGHPGRVVITDLFNYAMPFIRYDIQDVAVPSAVPCPCGRGLPLLTELIGRYADILTTPEGRFVSASALTTILPKIASLRECQLVQKERDWLQVLVVRGPGYDEASETALRGQLAGFFGPQMRITFDHVDEIPRTASGKKRFSVSELNEPG